jgi:DNA polymerase III delta prime subunit
MNIPWIEKYRPLNFDQILYNNDIINVIKNFINNKNIPNLILYGSSGIGKTSIVNIIVNSLYINNKDMVLELNNSDDRGINIIRNIREYARQPSVLSYIKNNNNNLHKLIILDEADSLTYEAQYALRRIIELYSNKIRFCMICNNLSKLDDALISRCNIFKLLSIPENV